MMIIIIIIINENNIGVLGGADTPLANVRKIPSCAEQAKSLTMTIQRAVVLESLRLQRQLNLLGNL